MKVTLKFARKKIKSKQFTKEILIEVFMIEIFKITNGYAPPVMDNFFIFRQGSSI